MEKLTAGQKKHLLNALRKNNFCFISPEKAFRLFKKKGLLMGAYYGFCMPGGYLNPKTPPVCVPELVSFVRHYQPRGSGVASGSQSVSAGVQEGVKKRVTLYLDEGDYRRIQTLAGNRGVAASSLVREAVSAYLGR